MALENKVPCIFIMDARHFCVCGFGENNDPVNCSRIERATIKMYTCYTLTTEGLWKQMKYCTPLILSSLIAFSGCQSDADVASYNVSKAADNFEVNRRIVFYNGISGEYILTIEGLCSLGNADKPQQLSVTCKTGPATYKKHFLGLSDNVTYFAEQIDAVNASQYMYRVTFKPLSIVPAIELRK